MGNKKMLFETATPDAKYIPTLKEKIAARIIQSKWKKILYGDQPLKVVRVGKVLEAERPDLMDFLNNEHEAKPVKTTDEKKTTPTSKKPISKSLNLPLRKKLLTAINSGNWQDTIFDHRHLSQLTLSLYIENKITRQQCSTILDRFKKLEESKHIQTYHILDADGNLTAEATELLIPVLNRNPLLFPLLKDESLQVFISAVKKLPKSEQIFYRSEIGTLVPEIKDGERSKSINSTLESLGALHVDRRPKTASIVHLSIGVTDALNAARFGKQHIPVCCRLGSIPMKQVEKDRNRNRWPRDIAYPGTVSDTIKGRLIHAAPASYIADAAHNDHHANVLSSLPLEIRNALLQLINVTRASFTDLLTPAKQPFTELDLTSKEIWEWIACDFRYFIENRFLNLISADSFSISNEKEITELFCKFFNYGSGTDPFAKGGYLLRTNNVEVKDNNIAHIPIAPEPTPVGIAVFLNMIEDKEAWLKIGINPDYLLEPYKHFYQLIKDNYKQIIVPGRIAPTVFNCFLLIAFEQFNAVKKFLNIAGEVHEMLRNNKVEIVTIKFKKNDSTKETMLLRQNRIYLKVGKVVYSSFAEIVNLARIALNRDIADAIPFHPSIEEDYHALHKNYIFKKVHIDNKNIFTEGISFKQAKLK